jgi:16S rRNA (guanine966-N2)-methyltransferase
MKNQTLRIISGKWKSRKIVFPATTESLRPTSDRIKENLFNWLQNEIRLSTCLDLFSGSGSLGIESLSRGASQCTFIEKDNNAYNRIKKTLSLLDVKNANIYKSDAFQHIKKSSQKYDFIFLDPPFGKNILIKILTSIKESNVIKPETKIYIEAEKDFNFESLATSWLILKHKVTGDVQYGLIAPKEVI